MAAFGIEPGVAMTAGAVAIFVKTPGLTPLQTRLAAKLGSEIAGRFHLLSAAAMLSIVSEATLEGLPLQPYWAVAEREALGAAAWSGLPALWQGEGTLGQRLAKTYDLLMGMHRFVLLIVADTPQLTVDEFSMTVAALAPGRELAARFVLGPSVGGGFYLFGGARRLPAGPWTQASFSCPDALHQLVTAVTPYGEPLFLAPLHELDDVAAIRPVRQALARLLNPTPAQIELSDFLRQMEQLPQARAGRGDASESK